MAREQPYEELTDELIIENVSYIYHNEARKVRKEVGEPGRLSHGGKEGGREGGSAVRRRGRGMVRSGDDKGKG